MTQKIKVCDICLTTKGKFSLGIMSWRKKIAGRKIFQIFFCGSHEFEAKDILDKSVVKTESGVYEWSPFLKSWFKDYNEKLKVIYQKEQSILKEKRVKK